MFNKTKLSALLFSVATIISSMYYTSKAYAWGSGRPLYAYIHFPGGNEVIDASVDCWRHIGAGVDLLEIVINGRKYIVHSSNVVLYER